MGVAAYNRGSRLIARDADDKMAVASSRADRQAYKDEVAALRGRVATLEHDLARARRCIAAERYAREKRTTELKAEVQTANAAVSMLCRVAFPEDTNCFRNE